jgi:signal transduction histidine kinase
VRNRLTLTRRYLLLIAAVMTAFITATLMITTAVMKSGMVRLFEQQIVRARTVLAQYESTHFLSRAQEMDAVLSSPRFLAAIETGDSSTITNEAPVYQEILGADVLLLADEAGRITYMSGTSGANGSSLLRLALIDARNSPPLRFVSLDDTVFEFSVRRVYAQTGISIGWIMAGKEYSFAMSRDLKRLTGLDVVVLRDTAVLGYTDAELVRDMRTQPSLLRRLASSEPGGRERVGGREIMYSCVAGSWSDAVIAFVGSPDEHVGPIRSRIMLYLVLLALGGGAVSMGIIYLLTDRYIGRQVNHLVRAAEQIASGDLERTIEPKSSDELGYLAGEMERMRSRIVEDMASLERAHQERVKSEKMAALGQMAAGIIHDFKNPIGVIRGTVELIQIRGADSVTRGRYCATINDQIDRMLTLAQDVLTYSTGDTTLAIREVNLEEYFESLRRFHFDAFQAAGIRLTIEGDGEARVGIDPARFRRVLDNLLNNARDALKPGQAAAVRWRVTGDEFIIVVTDNGPGISEEIRDRLFEPFVTSGKQGGTGLGLAIARKIVEEHGGRIEVMSAESSGAQFTIVMPRIDPTAPRLSLDAAALAPSLRARSTV